MDKMMTTQEVAEYLQVEHRWLIRQIRAGEFPAVYLGPHTIRIRPKDLEQYIEDRMATRS